MEGSGQPANPIASAGGNEALDLGATLRELRLVRKRELGDVADELRIRPSYLRAIEEGRFTDLPGSTYALGFVRAYAEYLGFDANEAMRRFKSAAGAASVSPSLMLPSPVAQGRLPTGAVLLIAAVLAILVYGGWYVMTTEGHDPGAFVAALPARVIDAVRGVPSEGVPESSSRVAPSRGSERASPAPPRPSSDGGVAVSLAPAPARQLPTPTAETGTEFVAEDVAVDQDEDEDTAPPPPEQLAPETPPSSTRIVLVAHADAWVELRDAGGASIYSRVLRKDERYEVPERAGLVMMTGNAGGVEVLVDGKATPSLGPFGAVKRNIVLDPDRLLAGTAVPPPPPPPPTSATQ